jgi:uncharacterized membrane protein YphA (DoxX/SURF4 family)/CheY-like chemotaxis protein
MKALVTVSRIIVGLLFIFSGLIKANDPLGLSYKMQEFFEVWGLHSLNGYTLLLSLFMNGFEILAGVAVLLGWRMKTFSWLLLLLIIFFTFLTGYALLSGKIKTCGCFGDCIPLTPLQSFIKDLVLVALIIVIFINRNMIRPALPAFLNGFIVFLVVVFCIVGQWYVLKYLPVVDCLPYKKGNNIIQQMKIPEGAVSDSFAIMFKYKKDGKDVEFDMNNMPADFNDTTYTFVDRIQKLVRKGTAQAPITDFSMTNLNNEDTTQAIFNRPRYVMLLVKDATTATRNWIRNATEVAKAAEQQHIPLIVVTATADDAQSQLFNVPNISVVKCDATVIKTAARVNPTYFIMQQATVVGKYADANYRKVMEQLK